MPSITDKITKVTDGSRPEPTTVTATRAPGVTTLSAAALVGWESATTAVHFQTYSLDANGEIAAGTQNDWKGIVVGSTITNLQLKAGTDNGSSIGDIIAPTITAAWGDEMAQGILEEHNANGTHSDITADSITVSTAATFPEGSIDGNELSTTAITLDTKTVSVDQASITTLADATGLAATVTIPAGGREARIDWSICLSGNVSGGVFNVVIKEGSTTLKTSQYACPNNINAFNFADFHEFTPSAGSHSYKLQVAGLTATVKLENAFSPAQFSVKVI